MTTATALAYPNIALVKYWGKQDESLILPAAGSLSLTLDTFATTTTVEIDESLSRDVLLLGGEPQTGTPLARVAAFLSHIRSLANAHHYARVTTHNEAPTGAGLASSASGFAALAVAGAKAYGLNLNQTELSRLARRGSGSASRSLISGVSVWHAGTDETSFAQPVAAPEMSMIIVTVDGRQKAVSSREAMRRTALTSPFYESWVRSTEVSLEAMLEACRDNDFTRIGRITETHAMRMHAVIQSCDPPIRYLAPTSIAIFDAIAQLRDAGIEAYGTADAGPNVAVIALPNDAERVADALSQYGQVRIVAGGPGAHLIEPAAEGSE